MKKILTFALCMALLVVAGTAFGQVKTSKKQKTATSIGKTPITKPVDNKKEICWEITGNNGDKEFRWDTEANVQQWINEMRAQHNEGYTYKPCGHSSVEACDANNEKVNPKKCWKITGTKNGQTTEMYLWSTETVARRKAATMRSAGYQNAKYVQTPVNDEKSCVAPANNTSPNDPACWKITIGNTVSYQWGYERDAQATVNAARNSGQTASYELSPNKTKDSCQ